MSLILKEKIFSPAAWKGSELTGDSSWIHHLSDNAVAALDQALAAIKQRGLSFPDFTQQALPLPDLTADLQQIARELENGKGFFLLRGLPVERYTGPSLPSPKD